MNSEKLELIITPHGIITHFHYAGNDKLLKQINGQFVESEIAGLISLSMAKETDKFSESALYFRKISDYFLKQLCHTPEENNQYCPNLLTPPKELLFEWGINIPPMAGAEYISVTVLEKLWQRFNDWTVARVKICKGVPHFLDIYASRWSRVGRVTLHLAENKEDQLYPFAFMASYSSGLTQTGKVKNLPLEIALKEYSSRGRKAELLKLLSPLHSAAQKSKLIDTLLESSDIFYTLVWTAEEAFAFLKEVPLYEEAGLIVRLPNWWQKRYKAKVDVIIDAKEKSHLGVRELLDFNIAVSLGNQKLNRREINELLKLGTGLHRIRGEWIEVDAEKLQQALEHWQQVKDGIGTDGISFIEGMRLLSGMPKEMDSNESLEGLSEYYAPKPGKILEKILKDLSNPKERKCKVPADFKGKLRHYQQAGLNWLWLCSKIGVGACLADDMGLGKTVQVLVALLKYKKEVIKRKPALLVVPASLLSNWKAESDKFTPALKIQIAHTSEISRSKLKNMSQNLKGVDLIITTYSMVYRIDWIAETNWSWMILDEAHAIKNPGTRQTKSIKKVKADAKIALTGTPVENRLSDLWSLFDFLNPGLLGSAKKFKTYIQSLKGSNYSSLRQLVAPYILRRMKTDPNIISDLPEKTEVRVNCGLSKQQAALYQQNVDSLAFALNSEDLEPQKRRGLILSYLLRFKQICNHPAQFIGNQNYDAKLSAKFLRLAEICNEINSRGEKVLIFTQFKEIIEPLHEYLTEIFGRTGLILHGGTAVAKRKNYVQSFQKEDGPPFFILSIKAGGTGLNLTAASHVIHFDRWWNPAVENQATDRAFRIGQKNNVLVHKFVSRGTVEEQIDRMLIEKQQLADAILKNNGEKTMTEMSNSEIIEMVSLDLKKATL